MDVRIRLRGQIIDPSPRLTQRYLRYAANRLRIQPWSKPIYYGDRLWTIASQCTARELESSGFTYHESMKKMPAGTDFWLREVMWRATKWSNSKDKKVDELLIE